MFPNENKNQILYFILMFLTYVVVASTMASCVDKPVKPDNNYYLTPKQKQV